MLAIVLAESILLVVVLYQRTKLIKSFSDQVAEFTESKRWLSPLGRWFKDFTQPSEATPGIFQSPGFELALIAIAWINLALITIPIAKSAYGPFGGGAWHLYVLLALGALILWVYRSTDFGKAGSKTDPKGSDNANTATLSSWERKGYQITFWVWLAISAAAPIVVNQLVASGVTIPRYLGSIAILFYASAILVVLVSNVYGISIQTKVPLLGLLLVVAVGWNVFRINDNHAVRLDPPADQSSVERAAGARVPAVGVIPWGPQPRRSRG